MPTLVEARPELPEKIHITMAGYLRVFRCRLASELVERSQGVVA